MRDGGRVASRKGTITVRCKAAGSVPSGTAVRGAGIGAWSGPGNRTVPSRTAGGPGVEGSSGLECLELPVPGIARTRPSWVCSSVPGRELGRTNRRGVRVGVPAAGSSGLCIRKYVPPSRAHKVGRPCGKQTRRHVSDLRKDGSKARATHGWPKGQCCGKALSRVRSAARGCCTITHHAERLER